MKENKKRKDSKVIPMLTITLFIVLVTMVAFFGVFTQKQNRMEDVVKDYSYAMDLQGARMVTLKPNTGTKSIIKDQEGKLITEELTEEQIQEKGYTKEAVLYNTEDTLTSENYETTKRIFEKRLSSLGVENYLFSLNQETGEMTLQLEENDATDSIITNLTAKGKFELVDSQTREVLLNNGDMKEAKVLYSSVESGTTVYLDLQFNKVGKEKYKNITSVYTNTVEEDTTNDSEAKDEEEADTTKKVSMQIDGEEMMSTTYDQTISNGRMQLSIGAASTDTSVINGYAVRAQDMAAILGNGDVPVQYQVSANEYVASDISSDMLGYIVIGVAFVVLIGIVIFLIRFKKQGLIAGISFVGLIAIYTLLIRYANVVLSLEGIFGMGMVILLNYVFIYKLLHNIAKREENTVEKVTRDTYKEFFLKILPICIMAITFCFIKWIPMSSFGMVMFWGILLIGVYHIAITYPFLYMNIEKE